MMREERRRQEEADAMVEKARLEREEMLKRETPAQRKKREKKEEREELEEEERAQRIHEEVRSRALFYHRNVIDATPLVSYLVIPLWLFHFGYSTLVIPLWFHVCSYFFPTVHVSVYSFVFDVLLLLATDHEGARRTVVGRRGRAERRNRERRL
jgi:hypothetical protein